MSYSLMSILVIAMLAVFGVLVTGLLAMACGGEFNRKYGNRLMQARVYIQAIAVGIIVLIAMFNIG